MTLADSTTAQIRAQVATILKHRPDDRVIGIRTAGRWAGAERETMGGREFHVFQCDSTLEIRQRLMEAEGEAAPAVVVTNLSDAEIGLDLLVRFARRQLHRLHPWPIVQEMFQARGVDPKLLAHRWLAEALLETAPPQGYRPAPTGMLDQETVWAILLRERLGLAAARPDAGDLLAWSLGAENLARYLALPEGRRAGIRDWVGQSAGDVGDLILACVDAGYGEDAAPLGLACLVVFGGAEAELREAAVRLERFTGNRPIGREAARRWAEAAAGLVEKVSGEPMGGRARSLLERVDHLLKEIRAGEFAHLSRYSPAGFEMRLERFGQALQARLQAGPQAATDELLEPARSVFAHRESQYGRERVARVGMAIRLLRWLARDHESSSFAEAADAYLCEGGFADRARYALDGGDSLGVLAQAYARLAEMATARREVENRRFAELLVNWTEAGSAGGAVLRVEEVLREVVARAAQSAPVLLIVADGMSVAVFSELIEDISAKGWAQWGLAGTWPPPVIAALPSITEVSRTSLFCGRLAAGAARDEIVGFSQHAELVKVSRAGHPPVLFHKASLSETSGLDLAAEARKEIASDRRKVVAVVVNAIDDHLAKGDQVEVPWTLRHLPILEQLLYAARDSGRVVILTSDHGHVIDRHTTYRKGEPGERHRANDGKPLNDELVITGSRVLGPAGQGIIAPWSEAVRYGGKKHGYHGGLTPQECVIPLAVLAPQNQVLSGWVELPLAHPEWWNEFIEVTAGGADSP